MKLQDILVTHQVEFLSEVDKILANFFPVLKVKLNFKFCMHKFVTHIYVLSIVSQNFLFLNFIGYEGWTNYSIRKL